MVPVHQLEEPGTLPAAATQPLQPPRLALPGGELLHVPPGMAVTLHGPFTQAQWQELLGGTRQSALRLLVSPELLGLGPVGNERLRYVV